MNNAICVHPENPHYFYYKGKPVLLITSAEHYGAVINKGFDYHAYFDALRSYGLNYTRIYCGAYSEHKGMFIDDNTLAPDEEQLIVPWARSGVDGCFDGGNLFDLDTWDIEYFQRLQNFISEAGKRDIIVEVCLFNAQYPETWPYCPMNEKNNIQKVGKCSYFDVQSFEDLQLLEYQKKYVDKITREVNGFDNVILEIIDEPTLFGADSRVISKWIDVMADTIINAEKQSGRRQLIAQQLEIGVDFTCDPQIDIITCQYTQFTGRQIGGLIALAASYVRNKPIELNETAYLPIWYIGDAVVASRVELWEFIVGGGAGFNQLNGYFTVKNPTGKNEINDQILRQMSLFIKFMNSFDFIRMKIDIDFIVKIDRLDTLYSALCEKGRQYVMYFHHSIANVKPGSCTVYVANPGSYTEHLTLDLPEGGYEIAWINPEDTNVIISSEVIHKGGQLELDSPLYEVDIALRIYRIAVQG